MSSGIEPVDAIARRVGGRIVIVEGVARVRVAIAMHGKAMVMLDGVATWITMDENNNLVAPPPSLH